MTAEEWQAWLNTAIDQYNAGVITQTERENAQRQYDLAMAQLNASSMSTKQLLTTAAVLGGVFLFLRYGKR